MNSYLTRIVMLFAEVYDTSMRPITSTLWKGHYDTNLEEQPRSLPSVWKSCSLAHRSVRHDRRHVRGISSDGLRRPRDSINTSSGRTASRPLGGSLGTISSLISLQKSCRVGHRPPRK